MANKQLKQFRASRDIAIDRIFDILQSAESAATNVAKHTSFKMRHETLADIYEEFNVQHNSLIQALATQDGAELGPEKEIRSEVDRQYFEIKTIFHNLFENDIITPTNATQNSANSNIKLPKLNVPTFDGTLKSWTTFIGLYDSLIHNNKLISKIEKFQYLLSVLSGEALSLIKNLPLEGDNYDIAYKSLNDRYHNKRALATFYWNEITSAPKINVESPSNLRSLLDTFNNNLKALKNLGFPVSEWDFVLFALLTKKIDEESLKRFEMKHASSDIPTFTNLYDFLDTHCLALNSLSMRKATPTVHNNSNNKRNLAVQKYPSSPKYSSAMLTNTEDSKQKCPLCNSNHTIYKCQVFGSKNAKERYDIVKQNKWCTHCLGTKHTARNCSSKSACFVCNSTFHHTLLHFTYNDKEPSHNDSLAASTSSETRTSLGQEVNTLTSISETTTVLLSTAQVEILDSRGNFQIIRVLLDSASQASFITGSCVNRLKLSLKNSNLSIKGLGDMTTVASCSTLCSIRPIGQSQPLMIINATIVPKICSDMPSTTFSIEQWPQLANIKLADNRFNVSGPIDMLLGADIFASVLRDGKLTAPGQPGAFNTVFGWIVMGEIKSAPIAQVNSLLVSCDSSIDNTLKIFWQLEEVPAVNPISMEDIHCEDIFQKTHSRNSSGRYTVSLPFRDGDPYFSSTRFLALKRFYSLERRLNQDPFLFAEYSKFMKDYIDRNHMEAVNIPSPLENNYYIPHHCVINPNSSTTRLRVVFDASAKSLSGISLNDTLLTGRKLQQDIVGLLLHFRLHRYVFTADIMQMYRQILVKESHRDFQRILWRFSTRDPIQDFRLTTVTFGVSASPYLAIRVLNQLAEDEKERFPRAAKILCTSVYVDDICSGSQSLEEAKSLQIEIISLLQLGCFHLRKWSSNHPSLLEHLPPEDCQQTDLSFDSDNSVIKILGLKWNPTFDHFLYDINCLDKPCTKRVILSEVARIFDPLGFLAPLTFFAKYLIQLLWSLGCEWDDIPPTYICEKWAQYKSELHLVSDLKIARHCLLANSDISELHGFADSSERGYAAVVYLRLKISDVKFETRLICGKSKVAPLKRLSIPRLELCAAVLLSKLMSYIIETYKDTVCFEKIYAWSDSLVALTWIKSSSHRWPPFISNRVSYIQDRVAPSLWHHVRSGDNPADCASRGLLPADLVKHTLWFHGPSWLNVSQKKWPTSILEFNSPEALAEEKKIVLGSFVSLDSLDVLLDRFSSLKKIKRIIAYCVRFVERIKNPLRRVSSALTEQELHQALLMLVKRVQHTSFSQEISNLENKTLLSKGFRKLNPFIGTDGILRVGGRLHSSGLAYEQKHPALLPRKHRLTELIIESTHQEHFHPGLQTVHFLVAQNFWILSPKRAIKHVLSKCLRCFKLNPVPITPFMGNLPALRINQVKPFSCVGVDYGGPFHITMGKGRGIKSQKAYICLFVCFATKAIHIELASDLSTDAFVAALRRFISRRGRLSQIFCDQGSNFIGSQRVLSEFMKQAAEGEKISFSFSAPGSPHFNGLSEAGIKSIKTHLFRTIGSQVLTYEELYTILVQIEALLNSRPLCAQSSDPNDFNSITPGHFLTLEPLTSAPDPDLSHLKLNTLDRWQLVQRLQQDIWKRWSSEYLHTLQQRQKWFTDGRSLNIGDLVLIKHECLPPLQWRLGRVVKTHPGTDGVVRVATVRTIQGICQRPLVKLCPLPLQ